MPGIKKFIKIVFILLFFVLSVFLKVDPNIFDSILIGFSFVLMISYTFFLGGIIMILGFLIKIAMYTEDINITSEIAKYLVLISIFYYAVTIFERYKQKVKDNYAAAEKISLGIAVMDEEFKYIYLNGAYAKLLGGFRNEIEGKNFKKYWYKEKEQKELYEWIEENLKNKMEWSGDILCKRKDGKEYWQETYIFPLALDNKKYEYIIIAKDITYRVEMEKKVIELKRKAVEASYEKSRFLANMSHDIRTPVNGIV